MSHTTNPWQRFTTRRWFGFLGMQVRVARALPAVVTVSQNSRQDIAAQMDVAPERMTVVPVGVDHTVFRPFDDVTPVPGRIMVTSSSDVPMKGLVPLLEAVAKLRTERDVELTVIGRPNEGGRVDRAIARLGLADAVHCVSGISDDELAHLYGEAQVAVVPSLYEGFSLPAIEAMSCGVAVVATTGGALPEVVGTDGETGLLVPPDDPGALAGAIARLLDDPDLRARLGAAGRERVVSRFTWQVTAAGTAACYEASLRAARFRARRWPPSTARTRPWPGERPDADRRLRPARASAPGTWCSTSGAGSGAMPSRRPAAAPRWWPSTPAPTRWRRCAARSPP